MSNRRLRKHYLWNNTILILRYDHFLRFSETFTTRTSLTEIFEKFS